MEVGEDINALRAVMMLTCFALPGMVRGMVNDLYRLWKGDGAGRNDAHRGNGSFKHYRSTFNSERYCGAILCKLIEQIKALDGQGP